MNETAEDPLVDRDPQAPANARREQVWVGLFAGTISVGVWWVTMASAPRYSYGLHEDMGNTVLFPILLVAAILGGLILPKHATLIGVMLVAPALLLAPFTAPRGDNDGLWLYIVPGLAILMALCVIGARVAARGRTTFDAWRWWRESESGERQ